MGVWVFILPSLVVGGWAETSRGGWDLYYRHVIAHLVPLARHPMVGTQPLVPSYCCCIVWAAGQRPLPDISWIIICFANHMATEICRVFGLLGFLNNSALHAGKRQVSRRCHWYEKGLARPSLEYIWATGGCACDTLTLAGRLIEEKIEREVWWKESRRKSITVRYFDHF